MSNRGMTHKVIGFIFARGGSKGVPRKNIRMLSGKPLIAYAIEAGFSSKYIDRVIVSTDDKEIAGISREYGAEVPFLRPAELAKDDSPEWSAWQHAVSSLYEVEGLNTFDIFVSLPPTSPCRVVEDVDSCIRTLLETNADIVITVKPADRNPYFNMVESDKAGYFRLVKSGDSNISQRQNAPPVFDVATVAYAAHAAYVLEAASIFDGKVKAHVVTSESGLDIDTELDFEFAEFLMEKGNG